MIESNIINSQLQIRIFIIFFIYYIVFSCHSNIKLSSVEELKNEVLKTETDFNEMVKNEGIANAFVYFADENAVLSRNNELIMGKTAIKEYFETQMLSNIVLTWKPDFVDVSVSGDMGYTYGSYSFKATKKTGELIESEGIFHTVWKKQKDGSWRYVWD